MIRVVCGIISNKEGEIFIARRKLNKSLGGYWEFPGGKLEKKETVTHCLERELYEELGMEVKVSDYLTTNLHKYDEFSIELIAYECHFLHATFQMLDHDKYAWVNIRDLLRYNLAPADIPIVQILREKHQ